MGGLPTRAIAVHSLRLFPPLHDVKSRYFYIDDHKVNDIDSMYMFTCAYYCFLIY